MCHLKYNKQQARGKTVDANMRTTHPFRRNNPFPGPFMGLEAGWIVSYQSYGLGAFWPKETDECACVFPLLAKKGELFLQSWV